MKYPKTARIGYPNHRLSELPALNHLENAIVETIHLSKDFKEFIELLNKNNVRYIVVGTYAVGLPGYVRFTGNLEIWVEPTPENADNLMMCITAFGFGSLSEKK